MAPNERLAIQHLKWLDNANPEADAQKAIKSKRLVLYTLGERGVNYPGISADQQQHLLKRCKTKVLPGATDTIQGKAHLAYIQRAQQYAEKFNQTMLNNCLKP